MPGAIFFTLKDKDETVSLVLSVPTEYKVAQLLTEVIEAVNLNCREANGGLIRYALQRQANNELLAAHVNFGHSEILQGETVYLTRSVSPRSSSPSQNGHRHAVVTAPPKSFVYPVEALRLQAVGDFEQAILVLLRQYHQTFQNIRASNPEEAETLAFGPESQLAMLVNEITALFLELIEEQYKNTFYEEFYNLLQEDSTRQFFEAHSDIRERLTNILLQSSYRLAQAKRYQNAHDFAALALQIEPENEQAETLEALCQQYLNLLSSEDEEERLELARYIAETDPDFGNIGEDIKRLDIAAGGSAATSQPLRATPRTTPGTAYVPPLEPYPAEVESRNTPPPKSSFSQVYVWLFWLFMVLALLALIFWIVTY